MKQAHAPLSQTRKIENRESFIFQFTLIGAPHFCPPLSYKYPHICFSVFHSHIPLIFLGFILRNICSGTYQNPGLTNNTHKPSLTPN